MVMPRRNAAQAEVKNGRPANTTAGKAMTADSQWNKPRVAGPISAAKPAHTATDSSITLAAAKPAMAIARTRWRWSR